MFNVTPVVQRNDVSIEAFPAPSDQKQSILFVAVFQYIFSSEPPETMKSKCSNVCILDCFLFMFLRQPWETLVEGWVATKTIPPAVTPKILRSFEHCC